MKVLKRLSVAIAFALIAALGCYVVNAHAEGSNGFSLEPYLNNDDYVVEQADETYGNVTYNYDFPNKYDNNDYIGWERYLYNRQTPPDLDIYIYDKESGNLVISNSLHVEIDTPDKIVDSLRNGSKRRIVDAPQGISDKTEDSEVYSSLAEHWFYEYYEDGDPESSNEDGSGNCLIEHGIQGHVMFEPSISLEECYNELSKEINDLSYTEESLAEYTHENDGTYKKTVEDGTQYIKRFELTESSIDNKRCFIEHYEDSVINTETNFNREIEKWIYKIVDERNDFPGYYTVTYYTIELNYHVSGEASGFASYIEEGKTKFNEMIDELPSYAASLQYHLSWTSDADIDVVVDTKADSTEGEDGGVDIDTHIVDPDNSINDKGSENQNSSDGTLPGAVVGGILVGAAGAAAAASASKKKKDDEYKPTYRMKIYKAFGDTLHPGEQKQIYARIVEVGEGGIERPLPELSASIQIYAGNEAVEVTPIGLQGDWMCANVSALSDSGLNEAIVSFTFYGAGGTFTQNVHFNMTQPAIVFGQENLGVPANKNEEFRVPFGIRGMSDNARVSFAFTKLGVADVGDNKLDLPDEGNALAVRIEPVKEYPRVYEAVVSECGTSEYPAGTTEAYKLTVVAEDGTPNTASYVRIEQDFPVYRIHLGLTLLVSTSSIGCYLQVRPSRVGVEHPRPEDYEYCVTEGSLLLLDYDKSSKSILRIAPVPTLPDAQTGEPGSTKVYAKKLLTDRYAHKSEATRDHQDIVDKLGIVAFPTTDIHRTGGRKIKICSTKGGLDAPMRFNADLEITVNYKGQDYSVKREVLLRSQPFVDFEKVDRYSFNKKQEEIAERLLHIQECIQNRKYMKHLFSLYDLIDRMTDGYDKRFGYDQNQIDNVMEIWTGFLEGTHLGANAEAEGVTLADELRACYAFMEGMRDSSLLGRIALGVCTSGYSEVLFTAMTVSDQIQERVYATKPGDKEMGFWDAVEIGVKEYGKQYVVEACVMVTGLEVNYLLKNTAGVDAFAVAAQCAEKYSSMVAKADRALCNSSALYKTGAEMLEKGTNYFNTLARGTRNALSESAEAMEQSAAKAPQTAAKVKATMDPSDFADFEGAVRSGKMKVEQLKAAQQKLARSSGPEKAVAREEYEAMVREVWKDKNALTQLQRSDDPYAANMRYEYNRYRNRILEESRTKALDDVAAETGIPREDLYNFNATGKKDRLLTEHVPNDSDESIMVKVYSDRTKDFTVDQNVAENAIARNFYKEMTGREAASIEQAKEFMGEYDVTVVSEFKSAHDAYIIERNPEAYRDLTHMVGLTKDGTLDRSLQAGELTGLVLNQKTVSYKGHEWYTTKANKSISKAADCEKAAQSLSGLEREAKLAEAQGYRYECQSYKREGIRQIVKQTDEIIVPRDNYRVARGTESKVTEMVLDLNESAKRVVDGLDAPAVFERILESQGLTLDSWGDLVSKCLG